MSTTYPQYPNSNFPDQIDSWLRRQDPNSSDMVLIKQFKAYLDVNDVTSAQNLINSNPSLLVKIFNADALNNIQDGLMALETFFKNDVDGYIQTKQTEFQAYVNNFTDKGVYNSTTTYVTRNFVHYNNEVYIALKSNLNITPVDDGVSWTKLSIKGDTGYGVGLTPKDSYSGSTQYHVNDLVQYNGNLYRCISDSLGNIPTNATYFALFLAGNGETLTNLQTTNNVSLVGAINEVDTIGIESTGYGVINGITVSAQSTPDMTVNFVGGVFHKSTGARLTLVSNPTLVINTADATNPRIDIIYINSDGTIGYTAGTPASSPVAPNIPVGAFLLYQVNVGANVTSITNANIVDMRKIKNTTDNVKAALDSQKADYTYQLAGGTATAITLTNVVLEDGHPKTFIASADNGGAATAINGKNLYKPGTTNAPTLKKDKAYTVWYSTSGDSGAGCFFFKASAEGTVTADKVLAGYTFSNNEDTNIPGGMDLQAQNIKKGITYGGIAGTLPYLPDNYVGRRLLISDSIVGSVNSITHITFTLDNAIAYYIDETASSYNIYKYDILNKLATNLGKGTWTATPVNICCNDDGSIVYVVTATGQIWYYDGTSWINTNQVAMTSVGSYPVICCNADGSELYFITGNSASVGTTLKKWIKATTTVTTILAIDNIYAQENWLMNWTSDGTVWLAVNGSPVTYKRIKTTDGTILNTISKPASFMRAGKGFRDSSNNVIGVVFGSPTGTGGTDYIYTLNSNNTTTQTGYANSYGTGQLVNSPRGEYQIWNNGVHFYWFNFKVSQAVIMQDLTSMFVGIPYACTEDGLRWLAATAINSYYAYN